MLSGEQRLYHLSHEWNKEQVMNWDFIKINSHVRLYYKKEEGDGLGFMFMIVKITSYSARIWDEDSNAYCMFHGNAAFDGIRHFYMGDEQEDGKGYINYPDLPEITKALKSVRSLEVQYCRDVNL